MFKKILIQDGYLLIKSNDKYRDLYILNHIHQYIDKKEDIIKKANQYSNEKGGCNYSENN
jgi:hypothetical protein